MTNYYKVLTKRRMKWQSLMKNPPNFHDTKSSKLKRNIRKGIPGDYFYEVRRAFITHNVVFGIKWEGIS